jgi:hypothetical protein
MKLSVAVPRDMAEGKTRQEQYCEEKSIDETSSFHSVWPGALHLNVVPSKAEGPIQSRCRILLACRFAKLDDCPKPDRLLDVQHCKGEASQG